MHYVLCRDCGCEIVFIRTGEGKDLPCDPEEVEITDCPDGYVLVEPGGKQYFVNSETAEFDNLPDNVIGYIRHFETCTKKT